MRTNRVVKVLLIVAAASSDLLTHTQPDVKLSATCAPKVTCTFFFKSNSPIFRANTRKPREFSVQSSEEGEVVRGNIESCCLGHGLGRCQPPALTLHFDLSWGEVGLFWLQLDSTGPSVVLSGGEGDDQKHFDLDLQIVEILALENPTCRRVINSLRRLLCAGVYTDTHTHGSTLIPWSLLLPL